MSAVNGNSRANWGERVIGYLLFVIGRHDGKTVKRKKIFTTEEKAEGKTEFQDRGRKYVMKPGIWIQNSGFISDRPLTGLGGENASTSGTARRGLAPQ